MNATARRFSGFVQNRRFLQLPFGRLTVTPLDPDGLHDSQGVLELLALYGDALVREVLSLVALVVEVSPQVVLDPLVHDRTFLVQILGGGVVSFSFKVLGVTL